MEESDEEIISAAGVSWSTNLSYFAPYLLPNDNRFIWALRSTFFGTSWDLLQVWWCERHAMKTLISDTALLSNHLLSAPRLNHRYRVLTMPFSLLGWFGANRPSWARGHACSNSASPHRFHHTQSLRFFCLFQFLGIKATYKEVADMFREADSDHGGYIDFDEFLEIFKKASEWNVFSSTNPKNSSILDV